MNTVNKRIRHAALILSSIILFCFIGINSIFAATEYTPLVNKDDYDFTANSGSIEEWFTYTAEGEVTSHIIQAASGYNGTPYSSMDCAQYVARVLLDAGSLDFGGYLACDGNMQVAEFLKLFAGEIPTGVDGRTVDPVNGTEVLDAASVSSQYINDWCAANCKPADILVFYGEDGNDLHIAIFSEMRDGVAYMWHSGSSKGVCEIAVSNIIKTGKVGHTITYIQRFRMESPTAAYTPAYTTLWINKVTADGTPLGGAAYGVYSDQGLINQISQLIDDNDNGMMSTPFELDKDGDDFVGTFYLKEIQAPSVLLTGIVDIDLRCGSSSIQDEYCYIDDSIYKVDLRITDVNSQTGTMNYEVSKITDSGTEVLYSGIIPDYPLSGSPIYIGDQSNSGSTLSETHSLNLEKTTVTSFDVTTTVFTLKSNSSVVATYSYENGSWTWKDKNGVAWPVTSFPLKAKTSYTVEESYTIPTFSCYDGNFINYQVNNSMSGWTKTSENTYEMSFTTGGLGEASSYDFNAQNDIDGATVSVTKTVEDAGDSKDGFKFELWNTEGSILLAKGVSDTSGMVIWTTGNESDVDVLSVPSGQYQLRELVPDDKVYGTSKAAYTYKIPEGFTESSDGTYWYKTITASSGTTVVQNVSNDRCQADIEVKKISEDDKVEGLQFDIYYGGNGSEPVWSYVVLSSVVTDSNGTAIFEDLPLGWYRIKEIVPEDYKCSWVGEESGGYKIVHLTESSDNQTVGITAINTIDTQIIITKTDAWTGNTISKYIGSPIRFRVYEDKNANGKLDSDESGSYVELADTDLDGIIRVNDVRTGAYLIEEVLPPCGYYKAEDLIPVVVDSANKAEITVAQTPYTEKVVIYKTDAISGEAVQDAVFTVYEDLNEDGAHQSDEPVAQTYDKSSGQMTDAVVIESAPGKYESDMLGVGSYVIVETGLPDGYFYSDKEGNATSEPYSAAFTIDAAATQADDFNAGTIEIFAENVPGGVVVYKVNDYGEMLAGAEFCVYADKDCKSLEGKLNDNGNGYYSYFGLDAGTYYLAETKAPEGYICDKNIYEFSVSCDKSTAVITNAFAQELAKEDSFCDPKPITGTVLADTSSIAMGKSKLLSYGETVKLTDYVACSGLNIGETYKLTGTLFVKSTGEALLDNEGNPIATTKEFTASSAFMTVGVDFVIDTTSLEGESIVAFEVLEDQDGNEYCHEDLNDEAQTLSMPEIGTKASDVSTGTSVMLCSDLVSIKDEVSYQNLQKNDVYKIIGTIIDKSTGEPLKGTDGTPVMSTVEFTATASSGTVTVEFKNVFVPYDTNDIVVYERIYSDDDVLLAVHEDINDKDQTITRALLNTSATAETTGKALVPGTIATVVDKVDYTGLIPGNGYVIELTLYKNSGEILMVNGQPVVNCVEFVAEGSDGTIDMPVTFDTSGLTEGEVVVVFESIKDIATTDEIAAGVQIETVEVCRHADLQCESQSLTVKGLPSTGERISHYLIAGAASAVTGCIGILVIKIRARKREE